MKLGIFKTTISTTKMRLYRFNIFVLIECGLLQLKKVLWYIFLCYYKFNDFIVQLINKNKYKYRTLYFLENYQFKIIVKIQFQNFLNSTQNKFFFVLLFYYNILQINIQNYFYKMICFSCKSSFKDDDENQLMVIDYGYIFFLFLIK